MIHRSNNHTPTADATRRPPTPATDLDALFADDALVDAAVASAQRDALRLHRLLGQPIVVWRDGRVVEEPAPDPDALRTEGPR